MPQFIPIEKINYPGKPEDPKYLNLVQKLIEINEMLEYIGNLPIMPSSAAEIRKEEKIKAIRGTTGIEGNVLDENEIRSLLESKGATSLGELEAMNSGKVHDFIIEFCINNPGAHITEAVIKQIHSINTQGISYPNNEPGKYRAFPVRYGYPLKETPLKTESEIQSAMANLVSWLNDEKSFDFPFSPWIVKGVLTHYAISRIHPFADGNGRTARAVEALIFCHRANVNDYCFYGIANYCYRNRDRYIEELAKVDLTGDASDFLTFCINGFYESLGYVKDRITKIISELMFIDYVHYLRRNKQLSKKATEVIDLIMQVRVIPYTDYYKRYFKDRSDESKRRYLKKFEELHLVRTIEKDGQTFIVPNLDVLRTLRRLV